MESVWMETLLDWDRLEDCLWNRLFTLSFLFRFDDNRTSLLRSLVCVCSSFRSETHRLWVELSRPYFSHLFPLCAYRALDCELNQRHMIASIVSHLSVVGVHDVCVAGGFAAWHLERWIDTQMGRDAFPRTVRGTHVWSGRPMRKIWVPGDVDVFVHAEDPELCMSIIADVYRDFCDRVFSEETRVHMSSSSDYHDSARMDDTDVLPTEEYIEQVARTLNLQEHGISMCIDARTRTQQYHSTVVQTSHHIVAEESETMLPIRLNVVFTECPPLHQSYVASVLQTFDMHHCRVALVVSSDTGDMDFTCTPRALLNLSQRRLHLTDRAFCNMQTCVNTVQRVDKYLACGFTFEGDDMNDVSRLHRIAHDHVRLVDVSLTDRETCQHTSIHGPS